MRRTPSKIPKAANTAFEGGNGYRMSFETKSEISDFGHTTPIPSPRTVLVESVYRTCTAPFSDFINFPSSPRNSRNRRACSWITEEIETTELHFSSCLTRG